MPTDERTIGQRIRELRGLKGLTQEVLAEYANLSVNYVGEIERGDVKASVRSLISIARALKVNPSELFIYLDKAQSKAEIGRRIRELLGELLEL